MFPSRQACNRQVHDNTGSSMYAAFNQRNNMVKTLWVLLFCDIYCGGCGSDDSSKCDAFFTLLPNERELMARLWAVEVLTGTYADRGRR